MAPPAGSGPNDRIRDGAALRRAGWLNQDDLHPESANADAIDHHDHVSGSPIPERDESARVHEPFGPPRCDQVDREEQQFYREVVAQLSVREAQQAILRRHIEPSTEHDRDFGSGAHWDQSCCAIARAENSPVEADSFKTPIARHQSEPLVRRVVIPAFFALALPMFAGAGAVLLFSPTDRPAAVIADNGSQSGEPDIAAGGSSVSVEPTVVLSPNNVLRGSIMETAAPSPNSVPQDNIIETGAPIGSVRTLSEDGVTTLRPSIRPPTSTASVVAPIQRAVVKRVPTRAPTNTANFAPLDSDAELLGNAMPPEVIALAPAHFPSAAPLNEQQPLAFAPTSDAAAIEPKADAQQIIAGIEMPNQAAQTARATAAVNMRAGPSINEAVITVVPKKAPIDVVECRAWCEVIYDGQQGWIHKRFVDSSGVAAVSGGR